MRGTLYAICLKTLCHGTKSRVSHLTGPVAKGVPRLYPGSRSTVSLWSISCWWMQVDEFTRAGSTWCSSLDDDAFTFYVQTNLSDTAIITFNTYKVNPGRIQVIVKPVRRRSLRQKLESLLQDYDRRENLGGLSVMKTWGLASMPKEGLVCACVSTHPGDIPEYVIPSLEKSTVVFASDASDDRQDVFPWQGIPAVRETGNIQIYILETIFKHARTAVDIRGDFSARIARAAAAWLAFVEHEEQPQRSVSFEETCAICQNVIQFESLTEASCQQGHQCSTSALYTKSSPISKLRLIVNFMCSIKQRV